MDSERRLTIAIGAALVEFTIQALVLIGRGALSVAPLRVVFLAAKLPLCVLARQRRPGAFLGVWVYEIAGFAAAVSVHGALMPRLATAAGASVVMVLLGRAISAFPTVEWRPR
jgi:hypothetical protein